MKADNSRTLIWIIVLLVVFNVSTLATIGYHIVKSNRGDDGGQNLTPSKGNVAVQYNGRFFRDSLNLSHEQMDKFRGINHHFRSDANDITLLLTKLRQRMMQNMSGAKPDTILLNNLSDSIGVLHARLKRDTYQYYLDIRGICNNEQQVKLKAIFEKIFSSESSIGCSNDGKGQGHRRGRGENN